MCQHATLRSVSKGLGLCFLLATGSTLAQEPVDIRFENADGDGIAVEPASGWPLTLSLTVDKSRLLGIGYAHASQKFPTDDVTGFFVFEDPDGCPSWIDLDWQSWVAEGASSAGPGESVYPRCPAPPPAPWSRDEAWIEITPGVSFPDPEECGRRPEILTFEHLDADGTGTNTRRQPIGPCVGSQSDGYGYGPNPRLPGLVVLADSGPGVITSELSNRTSPLEARNLAGLFHSVAYELKSSRAELRVAVHMHVPAELFAPVAVVDDSNSGCAMRLDGRQICEHGYSHQLLEEQVVTIRAFIVDHRAPAALVDRDGDGTVDIADARSAGLEPLSTQATFRFRQRVAHELVGPYYFDFDDDGLAEFFPQAPSGPGDLVDPPP